MSNIQFLQSQENNTGGIKQKDLNSKNIKKTLDKLPYNKFILFIK